MKMHLAGQSGDVARCKKVPNDVCFRMNESLKEIAQQLERQMHSEEGNPFRSSSLEQDFHNHNAGISINEGGGSNPNVKSSFGKRKVTCYFPPGSTLGA